MQMDYRCKMDILHLLYNIQIMSRENQFPASDDVKLIQNHRLKIKDYYAEWNLEHQYITKLFIKR